MDTIIQTGNNLLSSTVPFKHISVVVVKHHLIAVMMATPDDNHRAKIRIYHCHPLPARITFFDKKVPSYETRQVKSFKYNRIRNLIILKELYRVFFLQVL